MTTSSMDRARLRILDACLTALEEAHERDEVTVTPLLASRLGEHVRAVLPGMAISDAIDLVLREQEPHLRRPPAAADRAATALPRRPRLDAMAAGALTERIRGARHHVCLLLLDAHAGRAAAALGYRTWAHYVEREFGLSRRRSYELLDQGRVIRAVQDAAGMCGIPHISAHAAEDIKPRLEEVTLAIRQRVDGLTEEDRCAVVAESIRAARAGDLGPPSPPASTSAAVQRLVQAVDALAQMPAAQEMSRWITPDQASRLRCLPDALAWLSEFARAREERSGERLAS